jgi:hypothetical protein
MRRVLLALAACLALCGCGAEPPEGGPPADGPPAEASFETVPSGDIFFPRAKGAGFQAQDFGDLVVDGAGCLRIRDEWGDDTVPLWMRDWELETGGGGPRVLDDRGRTVGRAGVKVKLSGGEVTDGMVEGGAVVGGRRLTQELLERCPGDYFLVTGHQ